MKRIALAAATAVLALLACAPSSDADPVPFYAGVYEGHVEVTPGGDARVVVHGVQQLPVPLAHGYTSAEVADGEATVVVDCRGRWNRPDGDTAVDTREPTQADPSGC